MASSENFLEGNNGLVWEEMLCESPECAQVITNPRYTEYPSPSGLLRNYEFHCPKCNGFWTKQTVDASQGL